MKKTSFKRTALLLALACTCALCGCDQGATSDSYSGIVISQEKPHSTETEAYAETVIFSVLKYATQKKTGIEPNDTAVQKLKDISKNIQTIMVSSPIHEDVYRAFMEKVESAGNAVVDEVCAYTENGYTDNGFAAAKALYLDLSSLAGADYVGGTLYDLCAYLYQYKYDEAMANYDKYGYSYLKLDAERYQAEQTVLKNEIGKTNFITALKSGFAFADLLLGEGVQSDKLSAFTDTEILLFIQGLDVSSLSVTEAGWQLILSHALPNEGGRYAMKLLGLLKQYNLAEAAKIAKLGVKLLSNAIAKMTETDAALLREGDFLALIQSVYARFDESDWALFEEMTTLPIQTEYYDALAVETYGETYLYYKENLTVYALTDLRSAVGQDNFYDVLRGYIAGISPAFSYGMQND